VTSGRRDKQIQVYDPAVAGKQAMVQKSAGQADKYVGSKKAGQNVPAGQRVASAGGGRSNSASRRQQQGTGHAVQQQRAFQPRHREDDGNSALARTGYQQQYQQDQQYQQGQQNEQYQQGQQNEQYQPEQQ
jgi:replication-associated recombination protein RarA